MHESSMNPAWIDFFNFLTPQNSKPPIQNTIHTNLVIFFTFFSQISFESGSCRFHAGFKHISICAEFMSDSYRIQLNSVLPFIYIPLGCFHAVSWITILCFWMGVTGWCWIHAELMLNSRWFHAEFIFTLNLHKVLCNILHHNGVEFMLNSCWLQAKPWKLLQIANEVAFEAFNWLISVINYWEYNLGFFKKSAKVVKTYTFNGFAWIQHESNMISTPLLCKVLHNALWNWR